jgi:MFS family permease
LAGEGAPRAARRVVSLMFCVNGMVLASWASRIPAIQQHLQLDAGALGIALWGMAVGALLAFPFTGWLIARLGSRLVTTIAVMMLCVALILPALAPGLPLLWISLSLLGAANGTMDVAMNAQAAATEARYGRPIMSSFHGMWSVGSIAGAGIGSLMAWLNIAPLSHFLAVSIFLVVISLISSNWLLEVPKQPDSKTPVFVLPTKTLLGPGLIGFCAYLSEGAIADWSGVYLHGSLGASAGLAAAGYAFYSLIMTIARLGGDRLTEMLGPVRHVRLGGAFAAIGLGLTLLVPHPLVAILGFACVGAGLACVAPLVFSTASRVPGLSPGLGLAAVATMAYTGSLAGPPVIGQLAELLTMRGALGLLVVLCAVIALLAFVVKPPQAKNEELSELVFRSQADERSSLDV